jgi:hypothetical protein
MYLRQAGLTHNPTFRIFNAFGVGDTTRLRKPRSNANTHVGSKRMTTRELSDKEMIICRHVFSLQGTMEQKSENLKNSGTFDEYTEIHKQYLTLIKETADEDERNEGLKRIIFLNWYHMVVSS